MDFYTYPIHIFEKRIFFSKSIIEEGADPTLEGEEADRILTKEEGQGIIEGGEVDQILTAEDRGQVLGASKKGNYQEVIGVKAPEVVAPGTGVQTIKFC